jgi:molybdate transport system substrate-binding protein
VDAAAASDISSRTSNSETMNPLHITPVRRVLLLALTALVSVVTLYADEVRVMTSGGFAAPHLELVASFERATKHRVITVATSMGVGEDFIPSRIRRNEPVDIVILPDASLDELIKEGRMAADSRVPLARSGIGIAVRAGARKPDISSVDALRRTLLEATSVAYSASVSGVYLSTELFPQLGIADQMKTKSQRIERERVGAVVARGDAEIGFQQISELLPIAGIDYVGPLPADVQRITVFSAAVSAGARSPEAARALIRFFLSPEGRQVMMKSGLEPIALR